MKRIPTFIEAKRAFERDYARMCLNAANNNITQAAAIAGKDRKDFYTLMIRCGLHQVDEQYAASHSARVRRGRRSAA